MLPELVTLVYSTNGNVQSSASETLLGVLKHHKEDSDVVCMLLTCLRYRILSLFLLFLHVCIVVCLFPFTPNKKYTSF